MRQRNVDLANVIARDRSGFHARELAGIDGLLDGNYASAGFPGAKADQNRSARYQRLVVQPEDTRANPARIARASSDMGDHVAAFDEQFTVERDAHRPPC